MTESLHFSERAPNIISRDLLRTLVIAVAGEASLGCVQFDMMNGAKQTNIHNAPYVSIVLQYDAATS